MRTRRAYFLPLLFLGTLVAAGFSLAIGTIEVDWQQVYLGIVAGRPSLHYEVVMGIRLPRALNAFLVGGMLAVFAAVMVVMRMVPVEAGMVRMPLALCRMSIVRVLRDDAGGRPPGVHRGAPGLPPPGGGRPRST